MSDAATLDDTLIRLLQNVCEEPDSDTPRLVAADRFEECGEVERAEFIRVQCRIASLEASWGGGTRKERHAEYDALQRREWALLNNVGNEWTYPLLQPLMDRGECDWEGVREGPGGEYRVRVAYTRGFVSQITCTAADWLAHADALAWPPASVACPQCGGDGHARFTAPDGTKLRNVVASTCPDCTGGHLTLPRPTDPCPERCEIPKGRDGKYRLYSNNGPESRWEVCEACKGLGRVPRSFTGHEQPVVAVALTTWPEVESRNGQQEYRLAGGEWRTAATVRAIRGMIHDPTGRQVLAENLLRDRYSWLTFTLPA
jgi:uncharacterized protein (TIGR02996 family)